MIYFVALFREQPLQLRNLLKKYQNVQISLKKLDVSDAIK